MWLWVVFWLAILAAALHLFFKQTYSRFKKTDVKCPDVVPLLGTSSSLVMKKEHMGDFIMRMYNMYEGERFYGQYFFFNSVLVLRDIELIKQITVKDFDSFVDHKVVVDENMDPIFGRNLVSLHGQEWRDMRSALSPAFTSSKIKFMVPLMGEVGNEMIKTLKEKIEQKDSDYIDIEAIDLTTRYANDVIASCAFGLKVNSTAEPNNIFYKMGRQVTKFSFTFMLKIFMFMYMPIVTRFLNLKFLPKATTDFFTDTILNAMREREEHDIYRPDMIHLLLEAKKGRLVHEDRSAKDLDAGFATVEESSVGKKEVQRAWSQGDLVAQAVMFLLAGFETVSTAMSFAVHELSVNPEVQEKLVEEIKRNEEENCGKLDYNTIQKMTYMDMVVSEVLRLWPPAVTLDRMCTKDYNLGKANNDSSKDFYIRKGENVNIPVFAFHRDPKFFPNPMKFDPERFSEENKHSIMPFTYMPFGMGPRNCIGSRFALCEVKVMLYQLLQHFQLSPCEKTCIPVELDKDAFGFKIKGGHWVRLRIRE